MPNTVADARMHVVAAVIRNPLGQVLLAQRKPEQHEGGKWEFPGGKCEPGEPPAQALARELHEELGIQTRSSRPLMQIPWQYPDREVLLDVWEVTDYSGTPYGREGQQMDWVDLDRLGDYEYPPANAPIVHRLQLPLVYVISDATRMGSREFLVALERVLHAGARLIQLREPGMLPEAYLALAREVVPLCHRHHARVLLNTCDPSLVVATGADGMHLPSACLMQQNGRPVPVEYWLSAACHNPRELEQAGQLQADLAVLSPVKATPSHPGAIPMGWEAFQQLVHDCPTPVYALGGMLASDIGIAQDHGARGVAAISGIWDGGDLSAWFGQDQAV